MKVYEGKLTAQGLRFGIVVGRFNDFISNRLLEGAVDTIRRHGGDEKLIEIAWVPGSFEVPVTAQRLARRDDIDAVICLSVLIRGATPHFNYIAAEVTKGIAVAGMETGKPVVYGVITADTIEQAIERAGTKAGNKGADAARSAIEMADLLKQMP